MISPDKMMKAMNVTFQCWKCDTELDIYDLEELIQHECIQEYTIYELRERIAWHNDSMTVIVFPREDEGRLEDLFEGQDDAWE